MGLRVESKKDGVAPQPKAEYDMGCLFGGAQGRRAETGWRVQLTLRRLKESILKSLDPWEPTLSLVADTLSRGTINKVGEAWGPAIHYTADGPLWLWLVLNTCICYSIGQYGAEGG